MICWGGEVISLGMKCLDIYFWCVYSIFGGVFAGISFVECWIWGGRYLNILIQCDLLKFAEGNLLQILSLFNTGKKSISCFALYLPVIIAARRRTLCEVEKREFSPFVLIYLEGQRKALQRISWSVRLFLILWRKSKIILKPQLDEITK